MIITNDNSLTHLVESLRKVKNHLVSVNSTHKQAIIYGMRLTLSGERIDWFRRDRNKTADLADFGEHYAVKQELFDQVINSALETFTDSMHLNYKTLIQVREEGQHEVKMLNASETSEYDHNTTFTAASCHVEFIMGGSVLISMQFSWLYNPTKQEEQPDYSVGITMELM